MELYEISIQSTINWQKPNEPNVYRTVKNNYTVSEK